MKNPKLAAIVIIVFGVMLSSFASYGYQILFTPNILVDKEDRLYPIYDHMTFKDIQTELSERDYVHDLISFSFLAKLMDYDENVKPGMYLFHKDMTNLEAIRMLRSGRQQPVRLTFNAARRIEELPAKLTNNLEMDSVTMSDYMFSEGIAQSYGFDSLNFISMFLPNTYEVYWTASPKEILDKMKTEYDRFWNEKRKAQADSLGLTPKEVSTLASIVDAETNLMDEAPTIAGVYLNRIRRNYPLQADPTLVFAIGDHSIRRVLDIHKEIDSPYNTYKHTGLPPGPIMMPSIAALEAVLKAKDHQYLYFCAKEDFSGYHAFAETYQEHMNNARKFQAALNRERIYK